MKVRLLDKVLRKHKVATLPELPAATYSDGGGLYYILRDNGSSAWQFRYNGRKKTLDAKLSLVDARAKAAELYDVASQGGNVFDTGPVIIKAGELSEFRTFAHHVLSLRPFKNDKRDEAGEHRLNAGGFFIGKTRRCWARSIDVICKALHGRQLVDIERSDIIAALEPIWKTTPAMARETVIRLGVIFKIAGESFSKETGYPEGRNPCGLAALQRALGDLPEKGTVNGAHPSLNYRDMPDFWVKLRAIETVSSKALQVLILTGLRCNEALQAAYGWKKKAKYLDGVQRWVIPGKIMKHRDNIPGDIPLTATVLKIIDEMLELAPDGEELVFPAFETNTKLADRTLLALIQVTLKYNGKGDLERASTHGMRATFRSYIQDETEHSDQAAEFCLHHIEGSKAKKAYLGGDMFKKRLAILRDWEAYVISKELEAVEPIEMKEAA